MRGGLLGDGKLEALENGRLRALGHAVVLDVGFEAVEGIDLGVGVDGGSLEIAQQGGCLLIHGCSCLLSRSHAVVRCVGYRVWYGVVCVIVACGVVGVCVCVCVASKSRSD